MFGADARPHFSSGRADLLDRLVATTRADLRWHIEKAALAFMEGSWVTFYGTPDLVKFLSASGAPTWTPTITLP
jgi:hypothetical protein